jgi:acetyl esterase/lipase
VAVMIHGGGWIEGDKTMDNKVYICKVLANNGYVVFTINYRLLPEARVKKQVEDAMAAVIWVKEHAEEYGGDPERIGVMGGSAGGHIGALVAWASDDPWFEPTGYEGALDSDVKVAALYYPVIDFHRTMKDVGKWAAPLGGLLFTGKAGKPYKKALQHLSPHNHVDADCPPTLFLTGDADEINLYPQSVEYTKKLKDLGIDSKLYTAPGKKHGFTWNYWEKESVESVEEIVEFFDKYLKD